MVDNVRAGLNYEIQITGEFEKKLDEFEARVKKLQADSDRLGAKKGDKAADKSAVAREKASKQTVASAKKQLEAAKKQLDTVSKITAHSRALRNLKQQAYVAARQDVLVAKARLKVARGTQAAERDRFINNQKNLKIDQRDADVLARTNKARRQRVADLKQIQDFQAKNKKATATEIVKGTGISPKRLEAANKALGTLYEKEQQIVKDRKKTDAEKVRSDKKVASDKVKAQQKQVAAKQKADARAAKAQKKMLDRDKLITAEKAKIAAHADRYGISLSRAAKDMGYTVAQAKNLGVHMSAVERTVGNFFFTFRRLVGILAIFTLARKFAQYIGDAVGQMSAYNSELEQSKISFGALIAATGQMVDDSGNMVTGVDELNAALDISDELMVQLRKDALDTTATFTDLIQAFQFAVGPGLAAGLNLEEIETTAVNIAKAAGALKVPTNQLGEEIRSLVQGTITLKNTRLAVIGVTNREIRLAREEGRLFDYLAGKLQAFADASDIVSKTFAGLQSQVKDAVNSLLAQGAEGYFETLKDSMQEFVDALVDRDKISAGNFGFDEKALKGVQDFSGALAGIINDFRDLTEASEVIGGISVTISSIAVFLRVLGGAVIPFIVGLGNALGFINSIIVAISDVAKIILSWIPPGVKKFFKEIVVVFSSIVSVVLIWKTVSASIWLIYKGIRGVLLGIPIIQSVIAAWQTVWSKEVLVTNVGLVASAGILGTIQAMITLVVASIAAILVVVIAILYHFGLLAKVTKAIGTGFRKIFGDVGSVDKAIAKLTNTVFGQVDAVKKLEEEYQNTINKSRQLDAQVSTAELVRGIPNNLRHLYEPLADAVSGYSKSLDDANRKLKFMTDSAKDFQKQQLGLMQKIQEADDKLLNTKGWVARRKVIHEINKDKALLARYEKAELVSNVQIVQITEGIAEVEGGRIKNAEKLIELNELKRAFGLAELNLANDQLKAIKRIMDASIGLTNSMKRLKILEQELKVLEAQEESIRLSREAAKDNQFELSKYTTEAKQGLIDAFKVDLPEIETSMIFDTDILTESFDSIMARMEELQSRDPSSIVGIPNVESYINELEQQAADSLTAYNAAEATNLAIRAKLERDIIDEQAMANNEFFGSMRAGLNDFVEDMMSVGEIIADTTVQLLEGIAETTGDVAGQAIRGEEIDEKEVAGELLAGVVENMVTQMVTSFLQTIISNTLLKGALVANAATVATAMATLGGFVAANTLAVGLNTAILEFRTSIGKHGGGAVGYDKGGHVRSHVPGGGVSSAYGPTFSKPSNISPRDTVRAWLTPDEHVMTDKASNMFGHGYFDMLNRMARCGRGAVGRIAASRVRSPIIGRAGGGSVSGGSSGGTGAPSGRSDMITVVPVLTVTETVGEKIFAGANDSFNMNANKALGTNDLNRSGV